jgi:hypothetical protein
MVYARIHAMIQETEDRPLREVPALESYADVDAEGPVDT